MGNGLTNDPNADMHIVQHVIGNIQWTPSGLVGQQVIRNTVC